MRKELYFLRSSEQKIVTDIFHEAYPNLAKESAALEKYTAFYGLTRKDLGVYLLLDGTVAGAVWARKFQDDTFATVMLGVKAAYAFEEIAALMMEQFLVEAASQYDALRVDIADNELLQRLCSAFGFVKIDAKTLQLELEKNEIIRPSDGYDPRKWME